MKILVISSCTSKKLRRKAPAGEIYTGGQHRYLMEGLDKVRSRFREQAIELAIISAKHGLLMESNVIEPYDFTFQGLRKEKILEHSDRLQIHDKTEALIKHYDLVFFLLGKEYVQALQLPFDVPDTVTQIYLLGPTHRNLILDLANVHFIPAGSDLARQFGVMNTNLKGAAFKRLCCIARREGLGVFETIRQTPQQIFSFFGCSA